VKAFSEGYNARSHGLSNRFLRAIDHLRGQHRVDCERADDNFCGDMSGVTAGIRRLPDSTGAFN
jgi:hypothetical protein